MKFLPSQVTILARHYWCYPLTFHYFEPCSHYSYHLHKYCRHCRGTFFNKKIIHDSHIFNIRKYNVLSDPKKRRSQLLGLSFHTLKGHPRRKKKLQLKSPYQRKQNFRESNLKINWQGINPKTCFNVLNCLTVGARYTYFHSALSQTLILVCFPLVN